MRFLPGYLAAVTFAALALAGCCDCSNLEPLLEPKAPSEKPPVGGESALSPRFYTNGEGGKFRAGSAFVARLSAGGEPLLFTAHHLFGPSGGLSRQYRWDEVSALVTRVEAQSEAGEEVFVRGTEAFPIKDAEVLGEENLTGLDVAAFRVEEPPPASAVLTLARQAPPMFLFADVWLLTPRSSGYAHPAYVQYSDEHTIEYLFYDKSLDLSATSGAPVVNLKGEVIAINLGGGTDEAGDLFGYGNPVEAVRKGLKRSGWKEKE